ncbi:GNAT family N-acetyltransferase [Pseudomonas sp. LS44]|uniref:GNAT family N-acetyltransferase n=1 Tax=Pseudomonas sp. LS44 TaxID=1357074 RepID=UPI00215AB5D4|nr:GNAT family N-acetyltransferase [Pseudomonas sp. LS44]UVE18428.1 GNAT family N-acetyltransferase [Pseudomonas sp. LS44]
MVEPIELETPRLYLRRWQAADLEPMAALCADAEVMRYFPAPLSRAETEALLARIHAHFAEHGFGPWALQRKDSGALIGFTGLGRVNFAAPFTPAVEIGWRLARAHWRQGFASEAARAALQCAFERLELAQVVSFTTLSNLPSQGVMQALGMRRDAADDFDHPGLAAGDPLRRHVLYRLDRADWQAPR